MKTAEICVPAGALAKGEGPEAATPGVGDEVEFSGTGKVTRVEGDNVYLTPSAINGEPVMGDDMGAEEGVPAEPDEDDGAQMTAFVRGEREKEAMP
jgi:hypothetical protein